MVKTLALVRYLEQKCLKTPANAGVVPNLASRLRSRIYDAQSSARVVARFQSPIRVSASSRVMLD